MEARPCGCGIEFRSNIKVNKSESEGTSSNNIVVIKCRELSCEHIGDNTRTVKRCCATRQTACLYLLKENLDLSTLLSVGKINLFCQLRYLTSPFIKANWRRMQSGNFTFKYRLDFDGDLPK